MKESSHYFLASSLSSSAAWPQLSPVARLAAAFVLRKQLMGCKQRETAPEKNSHRSRRGMDLLTTWPRHTDY